MSIEEAVCCSVFLEHELECGWPRAWRRQLRLFHQSLWERLDVSYTSWIVVSTEPLGLGVPGVAKHLSKAKNTSESKALIHDAGLTEQPIKQLRPDSNTFLSTSCPLWLKNVTEATSLPAWGAESLAPLLGALVVHSILLGDTCLISHGMPEGKFKLDTDLSSNINGDTDVARGPH